MADEQNLFPPGKETSQRAWIQSMAQYKQMYEESIRDPEGFWSRIAQNFYWYKTWDKVRDFNFNLDKGPIRIEWFRGAKTNITVNCLDRHLLTRGEQTALIWEGNEPGEDAKFTYRQVYEQVNKAANMLKGLGVKKGDRVTIYMPMIPELPFAMLACARIGAIHSVIFGGFSPDSIADRILDCKGDVVITTDGVFRGKKPLNLKANVDEAIEVVKKKGHKVRTVVVSKRVGEKGGFDPKMVAGRDHWWHELMAKAAPECPPEIMDAEDPLFILYTSGSTGKPKGVLHTTGGYMVFTAYTHKMIFDYHDGDTYWCTADIGWVTGHSYIVYGPLANGATSIMFEGVPNYPEWDRFWRVVEKYKVTQFYTAPTAIRAIAAAGEAFPARCDLSSLRLLGTVGEPINPEAWLWYHRNIGRGRCPIVDTWWQTETGGILITPLPGAIPTKPGAATLPFFGLKPVILDDQGKRLEGPAFGLLMIEEPWPGMMRTVYGQHQRFEETYFSAFRGYYMTGDGSRRDEDGYYWITGRVDDVINVSGHRLGTAEVESALVSHAKVAEAAVVGFPHEIKGQGIYAYVTLNTGEEYTEPLKEELKKHVRKEIGAHATPDVIHWAPGLPKTRSGKIMRRILRKIASGEHEQIGDTTTLADPNVVEHLIHTYKK